MHELVLANVIVVDKFELKNRSKQDNTIFLNSKDFCSNAVEPCENESSNNCIFIRETIEKPLSRINYYLTIPIISKSIKDLTILYKYDSNSDSLPKYINICLSLVRGEKDETYYSQATYNWFPSTELYLAESPGYILVNRKSNQKDYDDGEFLKIQTQQIADGWSPTHYKKKLTII
ncbi:MULTISPECIES: type VI secretion system protein PdpE [Francisella]|uniref:type VI secretion system protein PdpE n=1 Tax=Francisella TaxID=262 RepID=UPI0027D29734|nr:type VI secretion system protein PdpE [Francisella opportunistica]